MNNIRWKGLALFALMFGSFVGGRWSIPREKEIAVSVRTLTPKSAMDISPSREHRTVIVPKTSPGIPQAAPVPVPKDLGQHIQTTTIALPEMPKGAVLHDALYGSMEDGNLTVRNVEWADGPGGRIALGDSSTVTAGTVFHLQGPPTPPRWGAFGLVGMAGGRVIYGGEVETWRGPVGIQLGAIGGTAFAGVGVRW